MDACRECGGPVIYSEEISSEVCSICGNLVDITQTQFIVDTDWNLEHSAGRSRYTGPNDIKTRRNIAMAGQLSTIRLREAKLTEAKQRIESIITQIGYPGRAQRAQWLFEHAMQKGKWNYGKTGNTVMGACIACALREDNVSEHLSELAARLQLSLQRLTRMYFKVKALMELKFLDTPESGDAILLFPIILSLLQTLVSPSNSGASSSTLPLHSPHIPPALSTYLRPFMTHSQLTRIATLATSLSSLTARVSLFANRAVPSVACALLMAAIEGHATRAMPNPGREKLANLLGRRFGFGGSLVLSRLREIYSVIMDWKTSLPWLTDIVPKKGKATGKALTKGKESRDETAKVLKDVVMFQDQIWRGKVLGGRKAGNEEEDQTPLLDEDLYHNDDNEDDEEEEEDGDDEVAMDTFGELHAPKTLSKRPASFLSPPDAPTSKRQRTSANDEEYNPELYYPNSGRPDEYVRRKRRRNFAQTAELHHTAGALLSYPSASTVLDSSSVARASPTSGGAKSDSRMLFRGLFISPEDMFAAHSHLMSGPPSRLTLLALSRLGGEADVDDSELFADGEMENYVIATPAGSDEEDEEVNEELARKKRWWDEEGFESSRWYIPLQALKDRDDLAAQEKGNAKMSPFNSYNWSDDEEAVDRLRRVSVGETGERYEEEGWGLGHDNDMGDGDGGTMEGYWN